MDYATKQILNKDKNNFVTNPTKINFENYNNSEVIEINSGDRIEKEYIYKIYIKKKLFFFFFSKKYIYIKV